MTAAYELPPHLFGLVAWGVRLAAAIVTPEDGTHNGRSLMELSDEWEAKIRLNGRHRDLLKPSEAASLLAVVQIAVDYITDDSEVGVESPEDARFALACEEIVWTLADIANSRALVLV